MEAEVVKMTAAMLGADSVQSVCGFMTSGGTERCLRIYFIVTLCSILMATKTYRDMAISRGLDPDEIEILASATAHAGITHYVNGNYNRLKHTSRQHISCELN